MNQPFIVPLTDPLIKYSRPRFSPTEAQQALDGIFQDGALTMIFSWADHKQATGNWTYWEKLYNDSINDPEFIFPELARSYIRWLVKGELKDNFNEED